jgi:hypothetical protein
VLHRRNEDERATPGGQSPLRGDEKLEAVGVHELDGGKIDDELCRRALACALDGETNACDRGEIEVARHDDSSQVAVPFQRDGTVAELVSPVGKPIDTGHRFLLRIR